MSLAKINAASVDPILEDDKFNIRSREGGNSKGVE
ncbi:uncharacterized protein CLAFUR5_20392 [Fulvia fulva]|nr:uncharacterized protein CLAFUR5_20392 [Fulvia fulva]KAK4608894.1 hypothetical protein CLAFUR0_14841 [Fulvia fulva]WMI39109.1 hypothetical protein CLAFUR5_20392 [Fulvia fulva]